jgi:membrane-associated phospholipid phosphatase
VRRIGLVATAAAAAFAALGGLVAAGTLTHLDQWACMHAMPLAGPTGQPPTLLESLVPLLHAPFDPVGVAVADIVTLPGQVVLSFLLVAAGSWSLWRRGHVDAAAAWMAAWVFVVAAELVCRHLLARPPLYRAGTHLVGLDTSWPSGHSLRCALVAAALAAAWPRLRLPLFAWLAAAVALTELAGFHTPTDVVGGVLLAAVAVAGAVSIGRSGFLRRRAALRGARPGTGG